MLIASNWVLNVCEKKFLIFPFIHNFSNQFSCDAMLTKVTHSLIHSLVHSLTHSVIHSFTHSHIFRLKYLMFFRVNLRTFCKKRIFHSRLEISSICIRQVSNLAHGMFKSHSLFFKKQRKFIQSLTHSLTHFRDAVATCFFLDTANNVFTYIDVIFNALKENGVWVNVGPLLSCCGITLA